MNTKQLAEQVARESYGRLLAILASRTRDIAAAEDALSEAFLAALRTWPERGIPDKPDAWLIAAARNGILNVERNQRVRRAAQTEIELRHQHGTSFGDLAGDGIPDERLKLLFVCAHPAIDAAIRAPLMLQVVLGLDAKRIGQAFLVPPATMGQRLVRAKSKIRDSGLRFEVASRDRMPGRLDDVLSAIYAAYSSVWVLNHDSAGLTEEAIYLARLLAEQLPDETEALGLLALLLYCDARRPARFDDHGRFVPLKRQDVRLWSRDNIIEAEGLLTSASALGRFGRYQCEAAIQSVHVQRGITGHTNYEALLALYNLLAARAPSLGSLVSRAAVLLELGEPCAALSALDALPDSQTANYQAYWTTRAHVLKKLNDPEAVFAHRRALDLTEDPSLREFLVLDWS